MSGSQQGVHTQRQNIGAAAFFDPLYPAAAHAAGLRWARPWLLLTAAHTHTRNARTRWLRQPRRHEAGRRCGERTTSSGSRCLAGKAAGGRRRGGGCCGLSMHATVPQRPNRPAATASRTHRGGSIAGPSSAGQRAGPSAIHSGVLAIPIHRSSIPGSVRSGVPMPVAAVVALLVGAAALRVPPPAPRTWSMRPALACSTVVRTAVVRMAVPKGYMVRSLKAAQVCLPLRPVAEDRQPRRLREHLEEAARRAFSRWHLRRCGCAYVVEGRVAVGCWLQGSWFGNPRRRRVCATGGCLYVWWVEWVEAVRVGWVGGEGGGRGGQPVGREGVVAGKPAPSPSLTPPPPPSILRVTPLPLYILRAALSHPYS